MVAITDPSEPVPQLSPSLQILFKVREPWPSRSHPARRRRVVLGGEQHGLILGESLLLFLLELLFGHV
jgi:hypothetical protein